MKIILIIIMDWYIRMNYDRPWTGIRNNQFKSKLCNIRKIYKILNAVFFQSTMVCGGKTKLIEMILHELKRYMYIFAYCTWSYINACRRYIYINTRQKDT